MTIKGNTMNRNQNPTSLTLKRNGEAIELTMQGMTTHFEKI